MTVYESIILILRCNHIPYEEIGHTPVKTTDDSARERAAAGWTKGVGSKNILFHAKGKFYLIVTAASKQIKARIFKKEFGTKDIRFAYDDEVMTQTGCTSGSVPPFGHPSANLPIYLDKDILSAEWFMFNPGDHTRSIRLRPAGLEQALAAIPNPVSIFEISENGVSIEKAGRQ
jgi:prolyl-tRNA editing enzyme YbaK/EbsC (Cys-tRNA(Pro) deacylase)